MPNQLLRVAAVLISIPTGLAAQDRGPTAGPIIMVRASKPWVSGREFRAASRSANAILGQAGVRVSWLECWSHDRATSEMAANCSQPARSNELILRIVSGADVDQGDQTISLGYSFVDLKAGAGTLFTVYADRVAAVARRADTDGIVLLGRTIAHEIGHLLLGTNRHGRNGLMRAAWLDAELRRSVAGDWLFSKDEALAMQRSVMARSQLMRPARALAASEPTAPSTAGGLTLIDSRPNQIDCRLYLP